MPTDFSKLGIRRELIASLNESGLKEPTPVQEQAIPVLLSGKDVIAQAQTGTGKTLAFVLPILEIIDSKKPYVQALIITPTRELALQITTEVKKLAPLVGASVLAAYGGQDVERQIKKLAGTTHIVIGTPGRLLDHLRRGTVQLSGVSMLVLDEADQMLHMGFLTEVEEIIMQTSPKRQTMLFSATMPQQIRSLAARYMTDPADIRIEGKRVTLEGTKQIVVETTDRGKQDKLIELIEQQSPYLAMVFCRTKRRAAALNEALQEHGYASDELHGDLSQAKREQVMKRFREAKLQILVATDVAARGLDVEGVTHIFNYDIPHDAESYIHRIGRTGRAGHNGMAITLATTRDRMNLEEIERGIGAVLEKWSAEGVKLGAKPAARRTAGGRQAPRTEGAPRRGRERGDAGGSRSRAERPAAARRGKVRTDADGSARFKAERPGGTARRGKERADVDGGLRFKAERPGTARYGQVRTDADGGSRFKAERPARSENGRSAADFGAQGRASGDRRGREQDGVRPGASGTFSRSNASASSSRSKPGRPGGSSPRTEKPRTENRGFQRKTESVRATTGGAVEGISTRARGAIPRGTKAADAASRGASSRGTKAGGKRKGYTDRGGRVR